jgi:hypothetical protein
MNKKELKPVFKHLIENNLSGDIAMFGVSKRDVPIVGKWAKEHGRNVHIFDSFEGLPEPENDNERFPEFIAGVSPKYKPGINFQYKKGELLTEESAVREVLAKNGLDNCFLYKGFYEETLSGRTDPSEFSALLIDVDYPSSLNSVLDYAWKYLKNNGIIACHEAHQKNIIEVFNNRDIMCLGQGKKGDTPHHIEATFYVEKGKHK